MVNEEIVGGLISALSRGEPLQKAMMTFYNAGYGKNEIEEAAKVVYLQVGAETAKTGYLQNKLKALASKVGLVKKAPPNKTPVSSPITTPPATPQQNVSQKLIPAAPKIPEPPIVPPMETLQDVKPVQSVQQKLVPKVKPFIPKNIPEKPIQEKKPEIENRNNNKDKSQQKVSFYEKGQIPQGAEQLAHELERAIKDLSQIHFPKRIEIVNKTIESNTNPVVVQKVSNYEGNPPKPVSKTITYLLIFILLLLLGVLAAVFFFKEDLIRLFNNLGLN